MSVRLKPASNCLEVIKEHVVNYRRGDVLGVGIGEDLSPFGAVCENYTYYNRDFYSEEVIYAMDSGYDFVTSFDALHRVPNPFQWCENMVRVCSVGGHVYVSTIFNGPYEKEYWRFTPRGLLACMPKNVRTLAAFWETDGIGVALLGQRIA